ncbi:ribosome small subunit-dependent GTPase A [Candidatus Izimaplasma bacterium ZiA1]|nr:ribosome small subunit-dependent GTPase A [Candidatus Izimaplasma bacterium ZiA1]
MKGIITKLIGGKYTVTSKDFVQHVITPRGKFRFQNISPKVGDRVEYNEDLITKVYERKNDLYRPMICNVDQVILINSAKEPDFSPNLLDRFLLLIEYNQVLPVIVITKIDLLTDEELKTLKNKVKYYEQYYDVYYVSSKTKENVTAIKELFNDKISVFSGQTGAGKSSLLNAIDKDLNIKTQEISKALGRGKHTTRHTELIRIFNGYVADTPGFSKLEFVDFDKDIVRENFVDFFEHSHECKYRGCSHINEPGCKVKELVEKKEIPRFRYQNYLQIIEEIESTKKKYRSD